MTSVFSLFVESAQLVFLKPKAVLILRCVRMRRWKPLFIGQYRALAEGKSKLALPLDGYKFATKPRATCVLSRHSHILLRGVCKFSCAVVQIFSNFSDHP
jgi:hypothetical protein